MPFCAIEQEQGSFACSALSVIDSPLSRQLLGFIYPWEDQVSAADLILVYPHEGDKWTDFHPPFPPFGARSSFL